MRIESVRLANLASLVGEWFIPLNEPAYLESGIFVITGKTGSGKSTILDAICFALYQTTPRLDKEIEKLISHSENRGFSEVIFSVNGERYRSSFTVFKGGKTGKSKNSTFEVQLENLTRGISYIDNPSAGKNRHKEEIENIIGMNFMQFRQSILLAQGEFAFFLTATPSQRADVLERLTNSVIYGKLSQEVYKQFTAKEREIASLQEKIKRSQLEELQEDQSELLIQIEHSLRTYQIQLDTLQKERDEIIVHENNLLQWKSHDEKHLSIKNELTQLENEILLSEAKRAQFTKNYHSFQDFYLQEEKRLTELKEMSHKYDSLNLIMSNTNVSLSEYQLQVANLKEDITKNNEERALLADEELQLSQTLESLRLEHNISLLADSTVRLFMELEHVYDEWRLLDQFWSDALNQESWRRKSFIESELKKISDNPVNIKHLENVLEYWKYVEEEDTIQKELEQFYAERDSILKQLEQKRMELKGANDHLFLLCQAVELSDQRANLTLNHPCPLCEQPIATLPKWDEEAQSNAKKLVTSQEEIKNLLEYDLDFLSQELGKIEIECSQRDVQFKEITLWMERFNHEDIDMSLMKVSKNDLLNIYDDVILKEHEREKLSTELSVLIHLDTKMSRYEELTRKCASLLERLECESGIVPLEISMDERYLMVMQKYDTQRIIASDIRDTEKKLLDISFLIKEKYSKEEHFQERLMFYQLEMEKLEKERSECSQNLLIILQKFQAENVLDVDIGRLFDDLKDKKRRFDEEERVLRSAYEQIAHKKTLLESQLAQLEESIVRIANIAVLLMTNEIDTIAIDHYESLILKIKSDKEHELEVVNTVYRELLEKRAQVSFDQQHFMKQSQQLQSWNEEEVKLRAEFDLWQTMQKMIGSQDGKKFRTFAQAITLDQVVALANDYLIHMQDRYYLQRDVSSKNNQEKLDFIVIDQFQGDVSRGIETLSGGERFLISLSLALGLAGLASENVKVESFFLDEGFGVLDEDSLQTVLDALTSLRDMGKVVGLISHVEQLKERIEQKIIVKTKGSGKSEIIGLGVERVSHRRNAMNNRDLF